MAENPNCRGPKIPNWSKIYIIADILFFPYFIINFLAIENKRIARAETFIYSAGIKFPNLKKIQPIAGNNIPVIIPTSKTPNSIIPTATTKIK